MTDPEEVITAIFTILVGTIIIASFYQVSTGGDVGLVSSIASALAVPVVLFLLAIYVVLVVIQNV